MTWTVTLSDGRIVRVTADAWFIGNSGDLTFYNGDTVTRQGETVGTQFNVRGFARGQWHTVDLYA